MWLVLIWSHGESPPPDYLDFKFPKLPPQTFIPVLFNLAEDSSRWNWATGRSKWIVLGEGDVISAAKQSWHLFRSGDLRPHGSAAANPEDKPISEIITENNVAHVHGQWGTGCITRLPRIPIIETTQWHAGQFSALLLKWSPIQFYVGHL